MRTKEYARFFYIDYCGNAVCGVGRAHSHLLLNVLHNIKRKRKTLSNKQAAQYKMTTKNTSDLPHKAKVSRGEFDANPLRWPAPRRWAPSQKA